MKPGQKVRVHFNLHSLDWSIVAMDGPDKGRVIGHASRVTLTDCTFRVSEASRQKVIAKRCRSVHAWIHGLLAPTVPAPPDATGFTYNPYRAPTFTRRDNGAPITSASKVWFTGDKAYAKT
jgi:hypothetical protein